MNVRCKRISDEEFYTTRKEVLSQWPTGKDIDLAESVAYRQQFPEKNCAVVMQKAKENNQIICVPQFGRAPFEACLSGLQYMEDELRGFNDGLIFNIFSDSYTRKSNFALAQKGLDRSIKDGATALNGYPLVNYGVAQTRKLQEAIKTPLILVTADEDSRLQLEIALASGWSGYSSRTLTEVISHCKNIPLEEMIRHEQYEDRLAGYYNERGTPVLSHTTSNLTGYDMAAFHIIVVLTQIMMSVEQGVKHILWCHGINMNLVQDVAMMRVTEKLADYYLKQRGHHDITLTSTIYSYLGAWPPNADAATGLIAWNSIIGIMAGANAIFLKCADEAYGTPTKESMASATKMCKQLIRLLRNQTLPESPELTLEEYMIELEVRAVIDKLFEIGDGDLATGMIKGVDLGFLDTMFSPWRWLKGNVLMVRDARGALRYLDHGNIPVPQEVIAFNKEKIADRERRDNITADLNTLIQDVGWASRLKD
ncbi:MAG: hypothetical protein LBT32_04990 [Peptococcaceae bacterium]|jgi:methylaspartate mutase epsilon subunit|nr:hypothetical protein [Peptococcaceae bacterium]